MLNIDKFDKQRYQITNCYKKKCKQVANETHIIDVCHTSHSFPLPQSILQRYRDEFGKQTSIQSVYNCWLNVIDVFAYGKYTVLFTIKSSFIKCVLHSFFKYKKQTDERENPQEAKPAWENKTAASVLLKLFISGNERCHSTNAWA